MKNKIDILVPVYNVEKYLEQCLESLINQSLKDINIICINDGSTDSSGTILRNYSVKDCRIKIIEQNNKGYGAALNAGLSIATSKYIGIVEPDDFIDPITFESLYQLAEKGNFPDIVKFAYNDYYENEDNTHSIYPSESSKIESHYYPFKISEYPNILIYHPSIWSGIYSREFIQENKITFVEAPGAGWTDNPFFISTMCLAKSIIWSNQCHYYYRRSNPNSSSNLIKDCRIPIQRALELLDFLDDNPQPKTVCKAIYRRCLIHIGIVLQNPNYNAKQENELIFKLVKRIPSHYIQGDYFTLDEKLIYKIYNGLEN